MQKTKIRKRFNPWHALVVSLTFGLVSVAVLLISRAYSPNSAARWPAFGHRFGVYVVNDKHFVDQALSKQPSFKYTIFNHAYIATSPDQTLNSDYVDGGLADKIYYYYQQGCAGTTSSPTPSCKLSRIRPDLMSALLKDTLAYIQSVKPNPHYIGFYAIDDSPGDITDILSAVHTQITQYAADRPMICGLGANLDYADNPGGPYHIDPKPGFDQAVANLDPKSCDMILIYAYDLGHKNADWSMSRLIPDIKSKLQKKGWDSAKQPLIGTPQAFGWPSVTYTYTPTAAELSSQIQAFCKADFASVAPFAWKTTAGYDRNEPYLAYEWPTGFDNSKSIALTQGLSSGISSCQTIWNVKPTPPTNLQAGVISPTRINLTWGAARDDIDIKFYKIFRDNQQIATVGSNLLSWTDTKLTPGKSYTYKVYATDQDLNDSVASNTVTKTTSNFTPTGLTASNSVPRSVSLSWSPAPSTIDIKSYKLFHNNQQFALIGGNLSNWTDSNLSPGSYVYKIYATYYDNSDSSPSASVTTIVQP